MTHALPSVCTLAPPLSSPALFARQPYVQIESGAPIDMTFPPLAFGMSQIEIASNTLHGGIRLVDAVTFEMVAPPMTPRPMIPLPIVLLRQPLLVPLSVWSMPIVPSLFGWPRQFGA